MSAPLIFSCMSLNSIKFFLTVFFNKKKNSKFIQAKSVLWHHDGFSALSEVQDLFFFPDLTGTTNLTHIRLDRASIKHIPPGLCRNIRSLRVL